MASVPCSSSTRRTFWQSDDIAVCQAEAARVAASGSAQFPTVPPSLVLPIPAHTATSVLLWVYLALTLGPQGRRYSRSNFVVTDVLPFLVVIAVGAAMSRVLGVRAFVRRVHWVDEDRAPTDRERALVLAEPVLAA